MTFSDKFAGPLFVTVAALPSSTLEARVRLAGWKPADLRAEASTLADGCHPGSKYLTADVAAATAGNMLAEADRIEADAAEAGAELDRRSGIRGRAIAGRYIDSSGRLA